MLLTFGIGTAAYADNIQFSHKLTDSNKGDMRAFAVTNIYDAPHLSAEINKKLTDALNSAIENITREQFTIEVNIPYQSETEKQTILDDVWTIAEKCLNENPLWFTVDRDKTIDVIDPQTGQTLSYIDYLSISYSTTWEDNKIEKLLFQFSFEDNAETMLRDFKSRANRIIAYMNSQGVTEEASDFEKALWLHDYLAVNSEYETDYLLSTALRSAYDNVINHKSVCEGYACAYKYLLSLVGVECMNAYNTAAAHEWNIVKIDGKWYHVDVTHDDPMADFLGKAAHTHFLIANDDIIDGVPMSSSTCHMHSEWFTANGYSSDNIDSTFADVTYDADALWRDTKSSIAFIGDYRYFLRYDKNQQYHVGRYIYTGCPKIVQCDKDMNVIDDTYYQMETPWYTLAANSYYQDYYTGLGAYGTALYYNTPTALMKIDTLSDTPKSESVYTRHDTVVAEDQIFGSYLDDNMLYYGIVTFSNSAPSTVFSSRKYIELPKLSPVTVTFNSNGGSKIESQILDINQKVTEPSAPVLSGYIFKGWYTDNSTANKYDLNTRVIEDMTLYAQWEAVSAPSPTATPSPTPTPTATPSPSSTAKPEATPTPDPSAEPGSYPYTISGISILNENGIALSEIPDSGSFIIDVNTTRSQPHEGLAYMITAEYDSGGVLVSVQYMPVMSGGNNERSYSFLVREPNKQISEIRAFIWNNLNSQTPLCKTANITFR